MFHAIIAASLASNKAICPVAHVIQQILSDLLYLLLSRALAWPIIKIHQIIFAKLFFALAIALLAPMIMSVLYVILSTIENLVMELAYVLTIRLICGTMAQQHATPAIRLV